MPEVLRFGISSLDELLGFPSEKSRGEISPGIYLPRKEVKENVDVKSDALKGADTGLFTTSVCIIGPTGTGKSIFALHMASTYLADCMLELGRTNTKLPAVPTYQRI